jgi:radical SAM superfamily enzyme YgiQ (UPF0313 family)
VIAARFALGDDERIPVRTQTRSGRTIVYVMRGCSRGSTAWNTCICALIVFT